jgi:hypothetical protein
MSDLNPLPGVPDIESPFFDAIFEQKGVSSEVLQLARSLHEKGYAVIEFPEPDLDLLAEDLKAGLEGLYDWDAWRAGTLPSLRITDAWKEFEGARRIAVNAQILRLLETLYGRRPIPFQTLNFPVGTQQALHSDLVHFDSRPAGFMCAVWVALEEIDESNGPIQYCPGSHRFQSVYNDSLGVEAPDDDSAYANYPLFQRAWAELVEAHGLRLETFLAHKGQALIWASNLLHGGAPMLDLGRTRHSQVTHYFFENCCFYTPLLSNPFAGRISYRTIMDIGKGEVVPNRLNGQPVPAEFIELCSAKKS